MKLAAAVVSLCMFFGLSSVSFASKGYNKKPMAQKQHNHDHGMKKNPEFMEEKKKIMEDANMTKAEKKEAMIKLKEEFQN